MAHDWAAIETALREGGLTAPEAALRFGVPRTTVYNHARRKGWALNPAPRGVRRMGVEPETPELVARLKKVALARVEALEAEAAHAAETPDTHVRAIEKMLALTGRMDEFKEKAAASRPGSLGWTPEYREQRREQLKQKVLKMLEQARGSPLPDA